MRFPTLAAPAALTLAASLALAGCGEGGRTDPTGSPSSPTASPDNGGNGGSGEQKGGQSGEGDSDGGEGEGGSSTVPAYFVGDAAQGPRLYREFQEVTGDPLDAAATLVAGGTPRDPDYRTAWPAVAIEDVAAEGGTIVVTLADDGFTTRPDGMSRDAARLALQQMVHTLQGVEQQQAPVQFRRPDGPPKLFGLDLGEPFDREPALEVRALVNVTAPEEGATVTGGTLVASGVASSFEANVPWEIRRGDQVVKEGFATADGWMDRLYPWEASIDVSSLEPGDYTFVAMTDDPSGGAEGNGPTKDSKAFTLE